MAKQDSPFPQYEELTKQIQEYSLRFNRAISANLAPAIREQANLAASSLEAAAAHAEKMAGIKDPQAAVSAQTELVNELGSKFMNTAKKLMELQTETNDELRKLVEEGMTKYTPDYLKKFTSPPGK